jgi:hypothetical protein
MPDIHRHYSCIDAVGDGSAEDAYRPCDWMGQRIDLFCRMIRGMLLCLNPDGTKNIDIDENVGKIIRVVPIEFGPAGFVVVGIDTPGDWMSSIMNIAYHPRENRFQDAMADDLITFRNYCVIKNNLVRNWYNGLGRTQLGTENPFVDIVAALNSFTAAELGGVVNRALRLRYVARLTGASTAGFPDGLGGEQINAPACVALANALDVFEPSDPPILIHILYELASSVSAAIAITT